MPTFSNPSEMFSARDENVRCRIRALNKLLGFGIEGEVWEIVALQVRADGQKSAISFVTTAVPFVALRIPKVPFRTPFSFLCKCVTFT
jgi:hypothetical protein